MVFRIVSRVLLRFSEWFVDSVFLLVSRMLLACSAWFLCVLQFQKCSEWNVGHFKGVTWLLNCYEWFVGCC